MITSIEFFNELDAHFKKPEPIIKLDRNRGMVINHPDLVNHILIKNYKNYSKGPEFERVKLLTGAGLIVIDGEDWRKHRQLIRPAFTKNNYPFFKAVIERRTQSLAEHWAQVAAQAGQIDLSTDMSRYGLDIILECIFSEGLTSLLDADHSNPFAIFVEHTGRDIELARRVWQLRRKIKTLIEQRRADNIRYPDMLDAMLHSSLTDGTVFSDNELIDEVITLIVAGHETSAITLGWMWLLLALNPQVEQNMRMLHTQMPEAALADPTATDTAFTEYVEQVMAETLRLYPPVWLFSRKALADDQWQDIQIPANTTVFLSPYYLQRQPQAWESPDEFIPERFAGKTVPTNRGDYIPFSAGPRRCIGDYFSLLEAKILFTRVFHRFKLQAAKDYRVVLDPAVNLRTAKPIMLKLSQI